MVKVHTLDIAPFRCESPPQKRSGMTRVLKGFHSFTCAPTRSSAIGMSHTCHCLPCSRSWYSFTLPRRDRRLSRPWCEVNNNYNHNNHSHNNNKKKKEKKKKKKRRKRKILHRHTVVTSQVLGGRNKVIFL